MQGRGMPRLLLTSPGRLTSEALEQYTVYRRLSSFIVVYRRLSSDNGFLHLEGALAPGGDDFAAIFQLAINSNVYRPLHRIVEREHVALLQIQERAYAQCRAFK